MVNIGNESLTDEQRKLVEDNIRLVYQQVHKRGIVNEDLVQEGMLGLINAARFYSPEFGVKFSTYACSYIWASLHGTYSDKKHLKNASLTCSYDDPDLGIQPQALEEGDCGFFDFISCKLDPISEQVIKYICEGFTKKEVRELLNISSSKLNSILDKVGRDLYEERYFGN